MKMPEFVFGCVSIQVHQQKEFGQAAFCHGKKQWQKLTGFD